MKNFNHLVSSDNKGYAVIMMEKYLNPGAFPGKVNNVIRYIEYNLQWKKILANIVRRKQF